MKVTSRAVTRQLGALLTKSQVERAVRYYVEPMCQDVDPAGADDPSLVSEKRPRLFRVLDEALNDPTEFRYIFLLADSGMGKSSALINYYARHLKRMQKSFAIEIVPLGIPDADERVRAIENKANKVLFLDAFDEDTLAIVDHAERLRNILSATKDFRRVLITCRTQFFEKDDEIPTRTGLLKVGVRGPGESAEYSFHRIYLSPFGKAEIKRYIRKRFPVWRQRLRRQAFRMVERVSNLSVRPLLLAHIHDLVREGREARSSVELYEEMVESWLRREEGFVRSKEDLRKFSELLAFDIYSKRGDRGAEQVTKAEIDDLAKSWGIPLESWTLTGRSLLNRDAAGHYKFAHRSIMEYLFIKALTHKDIRCAQVPWTDQMRDFFLEGLAYLVLEVVEIIDNAHKTDSGPLLWELLFPGLTPRQSLLLWCKYAFKVPPIYAIALVEREAHGKSLTIVREGLEGADKTTTLPPDTGILGHPDTGILDHILGQFTPKLSTSYHSVLNGQNRQFTVILILNDYTFNRSIGGIHPVIRLLGREVSLSTLYEAVKAT